tara:strand:+ start:793 stop:1050 length:258 start_codon:yes stop_codon:yes gene_type:complete
MVKDWIDDILEANENQKPSFGYLGYVESLIETSNNSVQQKSELLNSIDELSKLELDKLALHLKENQIHKDCLEQYKEMVKRGVFK